jgi:hypothetical protein
MANSIASTQYIAGMTRVIAFIDYGVEKECSTITAHI